MAGVESLLRLSIRIDHAYWTRVTEKKRKESEVRNETLPFPPRIICPDAADTAGLEEAKEVGRNDPNPMKGLGTALSVLFITRRMPSSVLCAIRARELRRGNPNSTLIWRSKLNRCE